MNRLIITTDLGHIKVYRVTTETQDEKPSIDLEIDYDFPNDHSRFENRDTDVAGRFPQGGSSRTSSGMSYGERHGEQTEALHSQLKQVAEFIDETINKEKILGFYLAAPKTIHNRLIEALDPDIQGCIIEHLPLDLVKEPKIQLLRRFNLID